MSIDNSLGATHDEMVTDLTEELVEALKRLRRSEARCAEYRKAMIDVVGAIVAMEGQPVEYRLGMALAAQVGRINGLLASAE